MTEQKTVNVSVNMDGPNMIIAYVLWWFLGFLGVHRFYLGRTKSGLIMLALTAAGAVLAAVMVGIPLLMAVGVWWMLDAYFTQKIVKEVRAEKELGASSMSVTHSTTTATQAS